MPYEHTFIFAQDRRRSAQNISSIREVWYGQTDLLTMIWFLGIIVRGVFIVFGGGVVFNLVALILGNPFPLYLFVALFLPEEIWYLVGLWRSATNNRSGWGLIVKCLYFVWVPLEVYMFFSLFTSALPLGYWLNWLA